MDTPMFLYHGAEDKVLPLRGSIASYEYLRTKVYKGSDNLQFTVEDNLDHEISEKELKQLGDFLHRMTRQNQHVDPKDLIKDVKVEQPLELKVRPVDPKPTAAAPIPAFLRTMHQNGAAPQFYAGARSFLG